MKRLCEFEDDVDLEFGSEDALDTPEPEVPDTDQDKTRRMVQSIKKLETIQRDLEEVAYDYSMIISHEGDAHDLKNIKDVLEKISERGKEKLAKLGQESEEVEEIVDAELYGDDEEIVGDMGIDEFATEEEPISVPEAIDKAAIALREAVDALFREMVSTGGVAAPPTTTLKHPTYRRTASDGKPDVQEPGTPKRWYLPKSGKNPKISDGLRKKKK